MTAVQSLEKIALPQWGVRFLSKKGRDAGVAKFERCSDEMEARLVASLMRQNGHPDAEAAAA